MKLIVNEYQYNILSNILKEDSSGYDDEDFFELGVIVFRDWIKKNIDSKTSRYPLSFLVTNYFEQFKEEINYSNIVYGGNNRKLIELGRFIFDKKIKKLPTLQPKVKFTKKYEKAFKLSLAQVKLPDYVTLTIIEDEPYIIKFEYTLDYIEMLKSKEEFLGYTNYNKRILDFMTNFMGTKFGNAVHGNLRTIAYITIKGQDKFGEIYKKQIRPEIKKLPNYYSLHSMSYLTEERYVKFTLKFTRHSRWESNRKLKEEIFDLWENMGYDRTKLKISD